MDGWPFLLISRLEEGIAVPKMHINLSPPQNGEISKNRTGAAR